MNSDDIKSFWKNPAVRKYMAFIGSKGGKAKGASKVRSQEQYAKVAEAQRERWRKYRAAKKKN